MGSSPTWNATLNLNFLKGVFFRMGVLFFGNKGAAHRMPRILQLRLTDESMREMAMRGLFSLCEK